MDVRDKVIAEAWDIIRRLVKGRSCGICGVTAESGAYHGYGCDAGHFLLYQRKRGVMP